MDGYTRGSAVSDELSVRERMRSRARQHSRDQRGPYLTPAWLDHSFVLPASAVAPASADSVESGPSLPAPRAGTPATAVAVPVFERPTSAEVDFAAVVRRSDTGRRAKLATAAGLVLALVGVVVFQLTAQPVAAACAILAGLVTMGAAAVRILIARAPVPYLEV